MFTKAFPLLPPAELAARGLRGTVHRIGDLAEMRARFARNHPVAATLTLRPITLAALALAAVVYVLPPLVSPFGAAVVAEIKDADARRQGTALYDVQGRFIGAFPSRFDNGGRFNPADAPRQDNDISGRAFTIYPDYKTLFVENPPRPYIDCLKALEDSNLDNPLINPHGVDAAGLLRAGGGLFRGAGGSTLSAQLVQQTIRPKNSYGKGRLASFARKAEEIVWTVPIMYGHAPNDRRFDQYLARHLPHLKYMQEARGTIWGIEASSQVLWGRPASELDPARQFILAAAVRRQILFPLAREGRAGLRDTSAASAKSWIKAIDRARVCADNPAVLPDPAERSKVKSVLDQLALTMPAPKADPVIEALGRERYGARWPERARDPFRRANIFAPYAMSGLRAEFSDAFGRDWSRQVAEVRTSIDIADERRFAPRFREHLRGWLAARSDLNPWYRPWATYNTAGPEPEQIPEVIVAVAGSDGRLVRYYSASGDAPYFGAQRDRAGRYLPGREDRQLASLGKIGSAIVLLRAGAVDARARRAFALSDTPAMEALVAAADPTRQIAHTTIVRLHWSEASAQAGGGRALDPAHSLANGDVAAAPRTQHWAAGAITAALADDWRPLPPPSLVGKVRLVDLEAGRMAPPLARIADSYAIGGSMSVLDPAGLVPPNQRLAAKLLFPAPICGGGTLRRLAHWCRPARTRLIWGKTATMDISSAFSKQTGTDRQGVVLRLAVAGGVVFADGRRYSFFLSLGGTDARHPLAIGRPGERGLEASALVPLLDFILADLEQGGSTNVR